MRAVRAPSACPAGPSCSPRYAYWRGESRSVYKCRPTFSTMQRRRKQSFSVMHAWTVRSTLSRLQLSVSNCRCALLTAERRYRRINDWAIRDDRYWLALCSRHASSIIQDAGAWITSSILQLPAFLQLTGQLNYSNGEKNAQKYTETEYNTPQKV